MADPTANGVRRRWLGQSPAICGWMTTSCPLVAETMASAGYDAVIIDMQHSATMAGDIPGLAAAIELRGAEPFVRVPSLDAALIGKLVDLGVTGIIVPLIETRAAAEALVAAVSYPPAGVRSFGPRRAKLRFGADYFLSGSTTIVTLAMIETAKGLDCLEEIAATPGLDGLFVGPADLALALGAPPSGATMHGDVEKSIAGIRERTWMLGTRAGIFAPSAEVAAKRLAEGFDLVTATPDLTAIGDFAARDVAALARAVRRGGPVN